MSIRPLIRAIRKEGTLRWPCWLLLIAVWATWNGQALARTFVVTKTADTNAACETDCSLREAIIAANQHPGSDVVIVPAGIYTLTLDGDEEDAAAGDLDIRDAVTVAGMDATATVIDANHLDRAFHIHLGAHVYLSGLTIRNGRRDAGGAIYNEGSALVLQDCNLEGNSARLMGGMSQALLKIAVENGDPR